MKISIRRECNVFRYLLTLTLTLLFSNYLLIARLPYGTQRGLLPLLPSGPDGVCNLLLRRTRLSTRSDTSGVLSSEQEEKPTSFCSDVLFPLKRDANRSLGIGWRRERDSNPRSRFKRNTRLAGEPLRPTRASLRNSIWYNCKTQRSYHYFFLNSTSWFLRAYDSQFR